MLFRSLPRGEGHARKGPAAAPFGFGELFRSKSFLLFLVAAGFCQSSHAVLYSFGTLTWRRAGIDDVTISMLWGESVTVEIGLMLMSGWLMQRIGVTGLIGLGLGCGMLRWTAMAYTTDLPALILLQALHAGTFAACHLGAMAFIQRALPSNGTALGQSIYYGLGTGATQAVIYQFAGLLYERFGQQAGQCGVRGSIPGGIRYGGLRAHHLTQTDHQQQRQQNPAKHAKESHDASVRNLRCTDFDDMHIGEGVRPVTENGASGFRGQHGGRYEFQ